MGVNYRVSYHELVVKEDLPKLGADIRRHLRSAIETRLMTYPDMYGKPLRRSLHGYRKLRVGDYRIIFKMKHTLVKVLIIEHRSTVYEKLLSRLP